MREPTVGSLPASALHHVFAQHESLTAFRVRGQLPAGVASDSDDASQWDVGISSSRVKLWCWKVDAFRLVRGALLFPL